MNTPVSPELAKLVGLKGFDEPCSSFYRDGELREVTSLVTNKRLVTNSQFMTSRYFTAPTIADAIMWLYEKHKIWVCVAEHDGWGYSIQNPYSETTNNVIKNCFDFDSPTEAYEAAIEYTLNNLI